MIRRFPFIKTCQNIYLNLKNYKPLNQRPNFHATNHPFVSNIQLLDQTYFIWLTREVPSRVVQLLTRSSRNLQHHQQQPSTVRHSIEQLNLTYLKRASPSIIKVITNEVDIEEVDEQFNQLLQLCSSYSGLTSLVEQLPLIQVSTHHINLLIEEILRDLPSPSTSFYVSDCLIEESRSSGQHNINHINSSYYQQLYKKLPYISSICLIHKNSKLYHQQKLDQQFQEYLIWISYHENDLKTLESLIHTYLSSYASKLNNKVLSYFFSAFINNYEIDYVKVLLEQLTNKGKKYKVEPILIETIIQQLVNINLIFDELVFVFSIWLNNGGTLSIKLLSILLQQYYKYGTSKEIDNFKILINQVESSTPNNDYMLDYVDLKYKIINRQPNKFKKIIVKSDLVRFKLIKKSISSPDQLLDFYYQSLKFCLHYVDDFNYINLILLSIKQDNLPVSPSYLNLVSTYYINHQNYLQLIKFYHELFNNQSKFNLNYIENAFKCFITTYPYLSIEFMNKFHHWLKSVSLPHDIKTILKDSLKIVKLQSQLTPYHLERNHNQLINLNSNWKPTYWKRPTNQEQIKFRLSINGFTNLIENNICPQLSLIKTTYRQTNPANQQMLIELMKKCRLYTKSNKIQFDLYTIQMENLPKQDILGHYLLDQQQFLDLNNNQKLFFARILMNKQLNYQSLELLNSIQVGELSDQSKQVHFNLLVRNHVKLNQFQPIMDLIDEFPINNIILSQYLLNQGLFLEKQLQQKVKHFKSKKKKGNETDGGQLRQKSKLALAKMQGLIGDISLRLNQDNHELMIVIDDTFRLFNEWIQRDL